MKKRVLLLVVVICAVLAFVYVQRDNAVVQPPIHQVKIIYPPTMLDVGLVWRKQKTTPYILAHRAGKAISLCQLDITDLPSSSTQKQVDTRNASYVKFIPWQGGELVGTTCYAVINNKIQPSRNYQLLSGKAKLLWLKKPPAGHHLAIVTDDHMQQFCKASINHQQYFGLFFPQSAPRCGKHGLCAQFVISAHCQVIVGGEAQNRQEFKTAYAVKAANSRST